MRHNKTGFCSDRGCIDHICFVRQLSVNFQTSQPLFLHRSALILVAISHHYPPRCEKENEKYRKIDLKTRNWRTIYKRNDFEYKNAVTAPFSHITCCFRSSLKGILCTPARCPTRPTWATGSGCFHCLFLMSSIDHFDLFQPSSASGLSAQWDNRSAGTCKHFSTALLHLDPVFLNIEP